MWVALTHDHLQSFEDMLKEYAEFGESYLPYSSKLGQWWHGASSYISFWQQLRDEPLPHLNLVRTDSLWLLRDSRIIGDLRFRHNLNEKLMLNGGHIGYCVRPTERNRGLATSMLSFGLDHARSFGLDKVLLTCDHRNSASIRVIEKNGGTLADECTLDDGTVNKRFWISLK